VGQEPSAIARHIEEERARLGSTVDALEARAHDTLDWRLQFGEHVWAGLGVAFVAGLLASAMFRRGNGYVAINDLPMGRYQSGASSAMQAIQTAILGFLAHEARQFVERQTGRREAFGGNGEPRG
jgi:hypothetical protein